MPRLGALALSGALVLALLGASPVAARQPDGATPLTITLSTHDSGPSLEKVKPSDRAEARRDLPLKPSGSGSAKPARSGSSDGSIQTSAPLPSVAVPGLSFDGAGVGITPTYSPCCAPPDTNAAVSPTQIVQWVNLDLAVFDKATGLLAAGYPKPGNSLWSGFTAGNCATNNDGDPIILYDQLAQRWLATQFSVTGGPPYYQCIAVSTGSDFTTTTWNRYAYSFASDFPDYPKAGVWPNAYFMAFNLFANGSSFAGAAACAFDRSQMLAGLLPRAAPCYRTGTSYSGLLPSTLDGATGAAGSTAAPPAGAPNTFVGLGAGSSLNRWNFAVDFTPSTPTSSFTGPAAISVPAYSEACGGGACIPQAGTRNQLDSLADRLMYRLAYRNFGAYESLVVTDSVKGSGTAAPRWYELRDTSPGSGAFNFYQGSSYAPDSTYRWMGSAAMDKLGNIALAYSASSSVLNPGIRYTGRLATDSSGTMRAEAVALAGTGSQTGNLHRWGDYSSMSLDPSDDCTFWYTTEYLKATGSFNWSTRLVSFKLGTCS